MLNRSPKRLIIRVTLEMSLVDSFTATILLQAPKTHRDGARSLYCADPDGNTVQFIYLLGAMMPLLAVEFAIGGSLRGAGDTRFPLVATILGLLVMRCGLAALATYLGLAVFWVYAALVGDYLLKGSMLIWRFYRGRWKTVVPDPV